MSHFVNRLTQLLLTQTWRRDCPIQRGTHFLLCAMTNRRSSYLISRYEQASKRRLDNLIITSLPSSNTFCLHTCSPPLLAAANGPTCISGRTNTNSSISPGNWNLSSLVVGGSRELRKQPEMGHCTTHYFAWFSFVYTRALHFW